MFRGPKLVQDDPENYMFVWEYSDTWGRAELQVLVGKKDRWTEASFPGDWDRLTRIPPVWLERAEELARVHFKLAAMRLSFDPRRFRGPKLVEEDDLNYVFQWEYVDAQGAVKLRLSLDKYSEETAVEWEGDLDRLRRVPCSSW
ncbi:hypothetical protein HRbin30_00066 [bacterium HR30]|nr:hypothetical protein HRbin30_00066 [bacterium HR30]